MFSRKNRETYLDYFLIGPGFRPMVIGKGLLGKGWEPNPNSFWAWLKPNFSFKGGPKVYQKRNFFLPGGQKLWEEP